MYVYIYIYMCIYIFIYVYIYIYICIYILGMAVVEAEGGCDGFAAADSGLKKKKRYTRGGSRGRGRV